MIRRMGKGPRKGKDSDKDSPSGNPSERDSDKVKEEGGHGPHPVRDPEKAKGPYSTEIVTHVAW